MLKARLGKSVDKAIVAASSQSLLYDSREARTIIRTCAPTIEKQSVKLPNKQRDRK